MKNLLKSFQILALTIFIASCQSLPNDILPKVEEPVKPAKKSALNNSQSYAESRNLETIKANKKKTKVALFLPFSGKNKDLGWQLFNAATLSLFDNDSNNNIELILVDSKNSGKEASEAFKEIINKKIKIVIGPIFSDLVKSIEADAIKNGITVISFSNNKELVKTNNAKNGIFLAGFLPEIEIDKITAYSLSQKKSNFAILAPNNQYGMTISALLKTMVKSKDGNFVTSELYQTNSNSSIEKAADKIAHAFFTNSKTATKGKTKYDATTEPEHFYPQIIMIPESGKNLSKVITAIKNHNSDEREFQIIGTSQLNDITTLNDSNLNGIWFAAPENDRFRNFEKKYNQIFNQLPPRISSIAYDSILSICEIMKKKNDQSLEFIDFATYSKNGINGIDGIFRYLPNGLTQRNLAVLKINGGKIETIEEPVEKFLNY
ncbi:MAG: penicillin-binding protein activator [Rickettsiales bacterium]|nr:penicillin-binding protein activator [Rickettsiales bacterium]